MKIGKFSEKNISLLENILSDGSIPFYWSENISNEGNGYFPAACHIIYSGPQEKPSPLFNKIKDILIEEIEKNNIKIKQFLRIRYFVQPSIKVEKGYIHDPLHIDSMIKNNLSMVCYVNESDGGTYIKMGDVDHKVLHEKGNYVIFDGSLKHAGIMSKKKNSRRVLNINFLKE
jgi:hypothetical protein